MRRSVLRTKKIFTLPPCSEFCFSAIHPSCSNHFTRFYILVGLYLRAINFASLNPIQQCCVVTAPSHSWNFQNNHWSFPLLLTKVNLMKQTNLYDPLLFEENVVVIVNTGFVGYLHFISKFLLNKPVHSTSCCFWNKNEMNEHEVAKQVPQSPQLSVAVSTDFCYR